MNREILFKAKTIDNGEWVEGYYVYDYCKNIHLILRNELSTCLNAGSKPNREDWTLEPYEIDPDTLCQLTGLTDKNGRKIWENDILICHANEYDLERVVFGEFNVIDTETLEVVDRVIGWHTEVIKTDALSECEPFCLPMPLTDYYIKKGEVEVLGNIFDNADLLEVE